MASADSLRATRVSRSGVRIGRRQMLASAGSLCAVAAMPLRGAASESASFQASAPIVLSDSNAIVETTSGKVRGYTDRGIHTFKGIPYGAAPVGNLRFLRPERPAKWAGVRDALQYGPACPQAAGTFDDLNQFFFEYDRRCLGEDCLRLNVWTPAVDNVQKRPVMCWLHGGGFGSGSSSELPSYDGRNLARRGDVVVVSVNHRLNAFGFSYLAELGERYADAANVGMMDIVSALEWVRDNVASFGGDAGNVTLFGQSGGGAKVNFLMAMPSARGLFHKAIVQSATPFTGNRRSVEFSAKHTAAVLTALGLTPSTSEGLLKVSQEELYRAYARAYMRTELEHDALSRWGSLTAEDLKQIVGVGTDSERQNVIGILQARYGWEPQRAQQEVADFSERVFTDNMGPLVDGRNVPEMPFAVAAPAVSAHVPLLIGHTLNEGGGPNFFNATTEAWTDTQMRAELAKEARRLPSNVIDALRATYPNAKPSEIYAHTRNSGGLRYRIETVSEAGKKAAQSAAPAYVYTFAWKTRVLDGRPRAFHRSEIPFVFDNTDRCANQTGGTDEARAMAAKVSDAWIAFARTGNPKSSRRSELARVQ